MFFFHSERCSIDCRKVQVLDHVFLRNVAEKRNLTLDVFVKGLLCTADNDIRLDTKSLQFTYTCLSGFCLKFFGCVEIGNKGHVDKDSVFVTDIMLKLSYRFDERLTFDVADCTADFDDGDVHIVRAVISVETALDLVSYVRDYLYCASAKIAAALFRKD